MTRKPHILVVDDHEDIRDAVTSYLERSGMTATGAADAAAMDRCLQAGSVDLIVLDVMMPGEDGITACARLRRSGSIPILMLTARGDEQDRLRGFDAGADDYLAKPFSPPELLARIHAILRRSGLAAQHGGSLAGRRVRFAHLELDHDARILTDAAGGRVPLTSGEITLLTVFLERAREVLSRDELMALTSGRKVGPLDRTVDNQVSRLRRKLERDPLHPRLITTVRNGGYCLSCDVEIVA